ncbi:hypothetical protein J2857_005345 [Neorhizobium galegae]|nr:hypothetical protein [Neorhizobium galegae]MBP2562554.1 hypothetical protein [Neorhizobium galegae]
MKVLVASIAAAMLFTSPVLAIEPIPGSITYKNPEAPRLKKSPIGSQVPHVFYSGGSRYQEWYVLQPNRSLKLVDRVKLSN